MIEKDRDENRCVCCGEIIPEGRQVCPFCEFGAEYQVVFDAKQSPKGEEECTTGNE